MAEKCVYHPGRDAVGTRNGRSYCQICKDNQDNAARSVDGHVVPRDCFIWYIGGDRWRSIDGTGCAHWIAHEKNLSGSGGVICLAGYPTRVSELVSGRQRVRDITTVRVGDIYTTNSLDHCGLVVAVQPGTRSSIRISIRHDSSRQGGVFTNDFHTHFKGRGMFYR